ncbi:ABC transporter substrate-binding protein [Schaalia cardiffensis]|uniref:ABC transporter substrate-binding protein n=1 Tax=Schaalia cardiffensis TaxID=181487 RepID=UPI0018E8D88E|nr:ABC transporter substrate-binding protein [Schaalia cardiffensis]MBJ2329590.1 ABC transporter substrate-binding protein [Schaalia cardiffensis]
MIHKRFLTGAFALLASLSLAACSTAATSSTGEPELKTSAEAVTVGLTYIPNVQFSPVYLAEDEGLYKEAGLDAKVRHHGSDEGLFTALLSGEENFVIASGDEALVAASQGMDLVSVGAFYSHLPGVVIVPASSPIHSLADLKGHSLGIPGEYGSSYFAALAAIQEAGLTTEDVVLTSIGYTQRAAIAQGSVDAVLGFSNNDLVQMQVAGLDVRAIPLKEDTPLVAAAMITTREWAQAHPEATRALVQATSAGAALAVSDPEKALDSTATRDESLSDTNTRATAKAVLEATIPLLKNSSDQVSPVQDADTWARMGDFLAKVPGLFQGPVDASKVMTNEYANN